MPQERVLLVQCCHPPQLVHIALALKERNPHWSFEVLAASAEGELAVESNLPDVGRVHRRRSIQAEAAAGFDRILIPMVNRGYLGLKLFASRLRGSVQTCGYEGTVDRFSMAGLMRNEVRPPRPPESFLRDLESYRLHPLNGRILIVESCHPSLAEAYRSRWKETISPSASVTTVRSIGLVRGWWRLRKQGFDGVIVLFTAEPGYQLLRFLAFWLAARRILVVDELGTHPLVGLPSLFRMVLNRFLHPRPLPPSWPHVLVVQSDTPMYAVQTVRRLRQEEQFREAEFSLLCREEDRESLQEQLPDCRLISQRPNPLGSRLLLWRRAARLRPDWVCANFTGRSFFLRHKLLFLLLNVRRKLVVNASLDSYPLRIANLPRLFRKERILFDDQPLWRNRVLVLDRGDEDSMRRLLRKLKSGKLAGDAPVAVFCSPERRAFYQSVPEVDEVLALPSRSRSERRRVFKALSGLETDLVVTLFVRRIGPSFVNRLFLRLPARYRMVFNAEMASYFLTPSSFRSLLRRQPSLQRRVLLIETDSPQRTLASVATIRTPNIAPRHKILVLCRERNKEFYSSSPDVDEVATARRWGLLGMALAVRRLRSLNCDIAAGAFAGRRAAAISKLVLLAAPARHMLAINSSLDAYYVNWRSFFPFLALKEDPGGFAHRMLLIQTEADGVTQQAVRILQKREVARIGELIVLCREDKRRTFESTQGVDRVITYRKGRFRDGVRIRRELRRLDLDSVAAVYSGRPFFRLQKLLFLIAKARHRLVINANFDCFYLKRRNLHHLLRIQPAASQGIPHRMLLVQTEADEIALKALDTVRKPEVARIGQLFVLCREDKSSLFEARPEVEQVFTYRRGESLGNLRLLLRLGRLELDSVAAVFSGRPTYRQAKLAFLLIRARHRLVINANHDCFYLRPGNLRRLLTMESAPPQDLPNRILLIQTEEDETMLECCDLVKDPKVAKFGELLVFCREDKRPLFEARPDVSQVITYRKGALRRNLWTWRRLRRMNIDLTAAVFSGRPIYPLQKLLFFLTAAPHRLVFNENLDCFFFSWRRPGELLSLRSSRRRRLTLLKLATANLLKALLFFPRLAYLVSWRAALGFKASRRRRPKAAA